MDDLYWEDRTDTLYASAAVAQGDGYWPSMISLEAPEDGTITSGDARELAAMLTRAADVCDKSNRKLFPAGRGTRPSGGRESPGCCGGRGRERRGR